MLNARVFAPPVARFVARALIFAIAIVVAASFATRAPACPGPEQQPLRVLYLKNDRIVVARVGKTETVKAEIIDADEEDATTETMLKTSLLVSATLKGEHEPVVYVYHISYGDYQDQLSKASEGDTLLVFLKHQDEGDSYNIEDPSYGVKKLTDADLKIYTRRLEELDGIMQAKEPSQTEIIEWLVRCTEEPATRWEGAYDLWLNQYALVTAQERQADVASSGNNVVAESDYAAPEIVVDGDVGSPEDPHLLSIPESFNDPDSRMIKLLTPELKNRLTLVLLNLDSIKDNNYVLVQLTEDWDDPRIVPFLLSQMRLMDDDSFVYVEDMMRIVARKSGDESLIALAEEYRRSVYAEDENSDAESEAGASSSPDGTGEAGAGEQSAPQVSAAELKRKAKMEYFIAVAENNPPKTKTDAPASDPAPEKP